MIWIALAAGVLGWADVPVKVSDYAGLRRALANAKPGTTILLEPGDYAGGFQIEGVTGTAKEPIVVGGRDPKHPPRIVGGGLHFVSVAHLEVRDLFVVGPGVRRRWRPAGTGRRRCCRRGHARCFRHRG